MRPKSIRTGRRKTKRKLRAWILKTAGIRLLRSTGVRNLLTARQFNLCNTQKAFMCWTMALTPEQDRLRADPRRDHYGGRRRCGRGAGRARAPVACGKLSETLLCLHTATDCALGYKTGRP
jgi:hypothetical protein